MITPSVKLAISAGMAPFSTCSGPVPRFQNTEEGKGSSGHTLPLKTQASFAGCVSPVRKHQSRLVRGLGGQLAWCLYFIDGETYGKCVITPHPRSHSKFLEWLRQ